MFIQGRSYGQTCSGHSLSNPLNFSSKFIYNFIQCGINIVYFSKWPPLSFIKLFVGPPYFTTLSLPYIYAYLCVRLTKISNEHKKERMLQNFAISVPASKAVVIFPPFKKLEYQIAELLGYLLRSESSKATQYRPQLNLVPPNNSTKSRKDHTKYPLVFDPFLSYF